MVTYFLVISLMVAGGPWRVMEDTLVEDKETCKIAAAEAIDTATERKIINKAGVRITEEYEIAVTCSVHHAAKGDPA